MDDKKFIELYERQKESGLSVIEFCANEIIAPSTFYYWKKKLSSQKRLPGFIPVVLSQESSLAQDSLPCSTITPRHQETRANLAVEIEFPNKTILRISNGLDVSVLKALVNLND